MKQLFLKRSLSIILLSMVVFLAGCGKSGQDMSFSDAYKVLTALPALSQNHDVDTNKPFNEKTTVQFSASSPDGITATGQLLSDGKYDGSGNSSTTLSLDANVGDASSMAINVLKAVINIAHMDKNTYAQIDTFSFAPTSGDAPDGGMIAGLANIISKKRISFSGGDLGVASNSTIPSYNANITQMINRFQEGLQQYTILKETGKTSVDGYAAYSVTRDAHGVSGFIHYLLEDNSTSTQLSGTTIDDAIAGILESPLEGYLVIYGKDNIGLRITSLTTKDAGIISGIFTQKDGVIREDKEENGAIIATGSIIPKNKDIGFTISIPANSTIINGSVQLLTRSLLLNVISPNLTIQSTIKSDISALDSLLLPTITESTPFSQILEGFGLITGVPSNSTGVGADENVALDSNPLVK